MFSFRDRCSGSGTSKVKGNKRLIVSNFGNPSFLFLTKIDYEVSKIITSFTFSLDKQLKHVWTKISYDLIQSLKTQVECYMKEIFNR